MQISIEQLTVSYDYKPILSNVFLQLKAPCFYGIIGPNGAGKSTLFKSMLGLISYTGTIEYNGENIEACRSKVVYVPQKNIIDLSFPATVFDIALMGRLPHKNVFERYSKRDKEIALESLEKLEIAHLQNRQISQLSGGQQQRVFIARALTQQADILFLDEPLVGVDMKSEEVIVDLLKNEVKLGKTILMIHHDLTDVEDYFDSIIMVNNRIVAYGNVKEVFTNENIRRTFHSHHNIFHEIIS